MGPTDVEPTGGHDEPTQPLPGLGSARRRHRGATARRPAPGSRRPGRRSNRPSSRRPPARPTPAGVGDQPPPGGAARRPGRRARRRPGGGRRHGRARRRPRAVGRPPGHHAGHHQRRHPRHPGDPRQGPAVGRRRPHERHHAAGPLRGRRHRDRPQRRRPRAHQRPRDRQRRRHHASCSPTAASTRPRSWARRPTTTSRVIQVQDLDEDLVPAELGSSDDLQVGDEVIAIGNALNLGGDPTVTRGIVSAHGPRPRRRGRHALGASSRPTPPSTRATPAGRS